MQAAGVTRDGHYTGWLCLSDVSGGEWMREFEGSLIGFLAISGEEVGLPVSVKTPKKKKEGAEQCLVLGYPCGVVDSISGLPFFFFQPH